MSVLRVVALDLAYAGVGALLLHSVGLVPSRAALARNGGLAFLLGWAIAGIAASYLLVAGAAASTGQTLIAIAVVVAVAYPLARRARRGSVEAPWRVRSSRLAVAAAALLAVYGAAHLWRVLVSGLTWWDAWAFWVPKASSIVHSGGLDTAAGGFTSFANPDYPPFVPAQHALALRVGGMDVTALVFQDGVLAVALVWSLASLLAPRVPAHVLWPSLLFVAALPNLGRLVGAATGDLPLAVVFAVAGVAAVRWRVERHAALGVVTGVLLVALPLVKKEGLFLALALVVVLALGAARGTRARLATLSLALVPVAAVVPWRAWLRANGIPQATDYDPVRLVDPGFLAGRGERLVDVLQEVPYAFVDPSSWLIAVPLALAAALVARRAAPAEARMAAGIVAVSVAGACAVYWISYLELDYHLGSSVARVPTPTVVLVSALLPMLLSARDPAAP